MPMAAPGVKREHVECYIARGRDAFELTTLSLEFRALQQFWKWAVHQDDIDRPPMERMRSSKGPDFPALFHPARTGQQPRGQQEGREAPTAFDGDGAYDGLVQVGARHERRE